MEKTLGIFSFTAKKKQKKTQFQAGAEQPSSACNHQESFVMVLYLLGPAIFAYDLLMTRSLTDQTCVMALYMSNRFFSFQALIEATIKEKQFL